MSGLYDGSQKLALLAAFAALALTLLACSSESAEPSAEAAPAAPTSVGEQPQVRVALGSRDLAVGQSRFVLGVLGDDGPIRAPRVAVLFVYLDESPQVVRATGIAEFTEWPTGAGVYVAHVEFDRAGRWGVIATVESEGERMSGQSEFVVNASSSTPSLGARVPLDRNKTDVDSLSELTTDEEPDPDLYELTIAEAASNGRPTVISFATPAFCTSATCGPQVQVVSSVKERHGAEADFIHVEVYDNPAEMDGDVSKGVLSPLIDKWGLLSEPFTFVLDGEGLVAAKFEGFVAQEELEAALIGVLQP